jgi:hypothetical protein
MGFSPRTQTKRNRRIRRRTAAVVSSVWYRRRRSNGPPEAEKNSLDAARRHEARRGRGSVRRRSIIANRAATGGVIGALARAWQRGGALQMAAWCAGRGLGHCGVAGRSSAFYRRAALGLTGTHAQVKWPAAARPQAGCLVGLRWALDGLWRAWRGSAAGPGGLGRAFGLGPGRKG